MKESSTMEGHRQEEKFMKEVHGEHPRDPGQEIRIKPYYDHEVIRERLNAQGKWEKIEEYEDATVRTVEGRGLIRGQKASLAIPRDKDPETDEYFDCDGARSRAFVDMQISYLTIFENCLVVEGFVALGDWHDNDPRACEFIYERWTQMLRDEDGKP